MFSLQILTSTPTLILIVFAVRIKEGTFYNNFQNFVLLALQPTSVRICPSTSHPKPEATRRLIGAATTRPSPSPARFAQTLFDLWITTFRQMRMNQMMIAEC
jgi:hypothetical protein